MPLVASWIQINYYNTCWSGYGNGSGNPVPESTGPGVGTDRLFRHARIPRFASTELGFPAAYVAAFAGDSGTICDISTSNPLTGLVSTPIAHVRIASITDGTSNTVMIGEDAARPVGYNHARTVYVQNGGPVDGVINPVSGGGGAWADPFSYAHLAGSSATGIRGNGICLINCTSNNEIYSFHPGGANMLFADGSVHFFKESMDPRIIVYMITRAGGEVVSADQY